LSERRSKPSNGSQHHKAVLVIACAVCVLAFALKEAPDERVCLRGLAQFPLPHLCMARAWVGVKCAGCGMTRAIIHLAEGDWHASWRSHRLGGLVALLIVLQIPYRLWALYRGEHRFVELRWQAALWCVLIALLLGNWLFDLAAARLGTF
jgi:hypothetical protein